MNNTEKKYETILDIIGNPGKYSSAQLEEILSDKESMEIYTLLCKTNTAEKPRKEINVDEEWRHFASAHGIKSRLKIFLHNRRAASAAAITFFSLCTIAAGIAISVNVSENKSKSPAVVNADADRPAPVGQMQPIAEEQDSLSVASDSIILFEDTSLKVIMEFISSHYGTEVIFRNNETADLHLYYRLDTTLTLDEIISQLNTFGQINIKRKDQLLTID